MSVARRHVERKWKPYSTKPHYCSSSPTRSPTSTTRASTSRIPPTMKPRLVRHLNLHPTRVSDGFLGFESTAIRFAEGITSNRSSRRFPLSSVCMMATPVMFPPGRARFETNPAAIGSPAGGHDDRNGLRCTLGGSYSRCIGTDHYIHAQLREFSGVPSKAIVARREPTFDDDVAPVDPAQLAQRVLQLLCTGARRAEYADPICGCCASARRLPPGRMPRVRKLGAMRRAGRREARGDLRRKHAA
jgi:hypothetical protein